MKARICTFMTQMFGPQNVFNVIQERGLPGHDGDKEYIVHNVRHF